MSESKTRVGYEADYHQTRHGRLLEDRAFLEFTAALAEEKFWSYLSGEVVEVGCGVGQNLLFHPDQLGVDISDFALRACVERGVTRVAMMNAATLALPDHSVDGVLCAHVLEHVESPIAVLHEFHRVLRPGGRVALVVPDKRRDEGDVDQHLHLWGTREISNLFELVGFQVDHVALVSFRLRKVLCRLWGPVRVKVLLSRTVGKVALALRLPLARGELLVHARKPVNRSS